MTKTFPKGIHPRGYKEFTADSAIVDMPVPSKIYLPVASRGKPEIFVKAGDVVKVGTLLAKGTVNVFASCSGVVVEIKKRAAVSGELIPHIIIDNDGRNETLFLDKLDDPTEQEIIERVEYCGVVGMGGAGFPTAKKLKHGKSQMKLLLINGAECEPYLNCDNRLMIERAKEVIDGALLLKKAAGAERVIIAVEDNKPNAVAALVKENGENECVSVCPVKTKYPQGDARRLIYSVTGVKIPQSKRTSDYGVLVNNVHTAYSVHLAVRQGVPPHSRVMTVSGGGIKNSGNYLVAFGTLFKDIIDFCGGCDFERTVKILSGGPMMGVALLNSEYSATGVTNGLLLLTTNETNLSESSVCINCARCAKVCPANIMPMYIDLFARVGEFDKAERYGVDSCIECGCCAFVCPAKRTLVTSIVQTKEKINEMRKAKGVRK